MLALVLALALTQDFGAAVSRLEERVNSLYQLLAEREKQVAFALLAADKATTKAEEAQQRVNIGQNEFRGALKDAQAILATRQDVERLVERVAVLEKGAYAGAGRTGGLNSASDFMFQVLPLLVSAIALSVMLWKRRAPERRR